jgi:AraC-like DNA-binding protein
LIRWLIPPKSPKVAKYIEAYWYLEKSDDNTDVDKPKLNPDPCAHLIVSLPTQTFQYNLKSRVDSVTGTHWLYPHCQTFELDHTQSFACIGVKFKVGAIYSLKTFNINSAILDASAEVAFNFIRGATSVSEAQLLQNAQNNPDVCTDKLDQLLLPLIAHSHEDRHSELTRRVIPLLASTLINELADKLNCSQRTLERSFLKVTGLTLKQCQAMHRLETILEYLYQRKHSDIDWADIAYQFGFSDQPHFIRYLKQQINVTPKSYVQQRGFTIDVYGGVVTK